MCLVKKITFLQVIEEKYPPRRAVLAASHPLEFENDRLTLDIPMAGSKVKGGWRIVPLYSPTVSY